MFVSSCGKGKVWHATERELSILRQSVCMCVQEAGAKLNGAIYVHMYENQPEYYQDHSVHITRSMMMMISIHFFLPL
jgi:hypothetical protein